MFVTSHLINTKIHQFARREHTISHKIIKNICWTAEKTVSDNIRSKKVSKTFEEVLGNRIYVGTVLLKGRMAYDNVKYSWYTLLFFSNFLHIFLVKTYLFWNIFYEYNLMCIIIILIFWTTYSINIVYKFIILVKR